MTILIPRQLPKLQWPAADRHAWEAGCRVADPFDEPSPAAGLAPVSCRIIAQDYARWLGFLAAQGELGDDTSPADRVTRSRLGAYFQALRSSGNRDTTIISRFSGLCRAMTIIAPGQNWQWIRKPDGVTLYSRLRDRQRPMRVLDSSVLYEWGVDLIKGAHGPPLDPWQFRDGLLIAILAARARRVRAMAGLRVGHELIRLDDRYRLELPPSLVKTKRPDAFDLPVGLTADMDIYLSQIRPILLGQQFHSYLWVGLGGDPLASCGIAARIRTLSHARFGFGFGPHAFRHALATSSLLCAPQHPGLAASMLGIGAGVIEQHYTHAGQVNAARAFAGLVERRTKTTRNVSTTLIEPNVAVKLEPPTLPAAD